MIWLASYPRSGNTFFRIILDKVYGIESSTFHREKGYPIDENYARYPVVKTHLLPDQLVPSDPSIPAVYLVRDGRDCIVSLAHYRMNLIAPKSDYEANLLEAIDASEGSHFGGWSEHVRQWCARASLIIKFEDLIVDPIGCVEQLRPLLNLPKPRVERLPSFAELKLKDFKYGSGLQHGFDKTTRERVRNTKFRRGRVGAWKDELPELFHLRFLRLHGKGLVKFNYIDSLTKPIETNALKPVVQLINRASNQKHIKRRVLIDASKLLEPGTDGIKRYVQELLRAMLPIAHQHRNIWEINVSFGLAETFSLLDIAEDIEKGLPPLSRIYKLFRPDQTNPINACRQRLKELDGRLGWKLILETFRYNYLKFQRSLLKRYRELAKFIIHMLVYRGKTFHRSKTQGYDMVHLTLPNTWALYCHIDAPFLTTVHDLSHQICPEFQNASNNHSLSKGLHFAQSVDSDFISVSQSTKEQIVEFLGVNPERIKVVHEACDVKRFIPVASADKLKRMRSKYGIPDEPFILFVGTLEPRKNLVNVVRAFSLLTDEAPELCTNMVIAGSYGWGNMKELKQMMDECHRIHTIGHVDEEDLPALYSAAAVFCFLSHYEGFGLPLLEALSCGVPSVYSNVTSMPEIAAYAGLPASPNDVQEIKGRLRELLENEQLRQRISRLSVLRSLEFSWEKAAEETFTCYEHFFQTLSENKLTSDYTERWDAGTTDCLQGSLGMDGKDATA